MPISFEFKPTFRDMQGRFARAGSELLSDHRDNVRALAAEFRDLAQDQAPKDKGRFAKTIGFRTFGSGAALGFSIFMAEPLGTWIRGGTKAHGIAPRNKKALYWPGARHPVAYVNHPGTAPNPFMTRAYRQWRPSAAAGIRKISTRYVQNLSG